MKTEILVIDDDADLLEFYRLTLEAQGYSVRLASNGREAKAILKSGRPDLILMDVMMPDMNGVELCRWVRAQESSKKNSNHPNQRDQR